jgi:N-methylhydantoinase B
MAAPRAEQPPLDPITAEIIQESLQAVSDEMFAVLRKTAMSPIIYEVLDAGTAVTDRDGNLASSGAGIPTFVGVLDKAVKRILELHHVPGAIRPGDVFVTNDPTYGGVTHLNDVVLAMPVFAADRPVAWTASIAHWNDIGGMVPGSVSTRAREIYQEGLRLPGVKIVDQGALLRPVVEIMRCNSRLPDFLVGDMWAGIASVRVGAARVAEVASKYGVDVFLRAVEDHLDVGRKTMLGALAKLPKGRFELAEEQDSGAIYSVAVEITGDEFLVDARDNPDQDDGPNNVSRDGATIAAQIALMNVANVHGTANAGHFSPLRVLTRPGSVFDPFEGAACAVYYEVRMRLCDLILRCLAPHLGERLPAGGFASVCGTFIGGPHPETGRHFTIVEPQVGGWGGAPARDGNNAMFSGFHGDTYNCPAEIAEARYGMYVDRLALSDENGGEGRHRGGKGIVLDYRVRSDGCFITCAYTRSVHPPWALGGGLPGSPNYVEILRTNGTVERLAVVTTLEVNRGDVIRIHTGNGGGYGDPGSRPAEHVLEDVRNGYLSEERAREVYGLRPAES